MADAPKDMPEKGRTLITNIGLLLTGDLDAPIADSDCLLIEDGKIVGFEAADADRKIDAAGCAVAPGLIDGHIRFLATGRPVRTKLAGSK